MKDACPIFWDSVISRVFRTSEANDGGSFFVRTHQFHGTGGFVLVIFLRGGFSKEGRGGGTEHGTGRPFF